MTKRGIGLVLVSALCAILAFGTGIRVFFYIVISLGVLLLYALLSGFLAALSLTYRGRLLNSDALRLGVTVFQVDFRGFLIFPCLCDIGVTTPGKTNQSRRGMQSYVLCLLPGICKKKLQVDMDCAHKGVWRVGIERLRIHDIFGLVSIPSLQDGETQKLTVHPKIHTRNANGEKSANQSGPTAQVKDAEQGEAVSGSRTYRYGDPLKRIHWKQSAKAQEIYVKKYEREQSPQVLVLLDTACGFSQQDCGDLSCDIAATAADFYLNRNDSVRLVFLRVSSKTGQEETECFASHVSEFQNLDALLVDAPFTLTKKPLDMPLVDMVRQRQVNTVLIISSLPSKALLNAAATLREMGCTIACISPAETPQNDLDGCPLPPLWVTEAGQIPDVLGGCLS